MFQILRIDEAIISFALQKGKVEMSKLGMLDLLFDKII